MGVGFIEKSASLLVAQGNSSLPFAAVCKQTLGGVEGVSFGRAQREAIRLCVYRFCMAVRELQVTAPAVSQCHSSGGGLAITQDFSSIRSALGRVGLHHWLRLSLFS